ncbi:LPS export ABC transporter permease LptG [Qipengyuania sp. JC766]|uniref:LPS export ABC transporter permease LptG n=1 Tax=Qipengyuania sp. JC766 TaxID=3232139 RepID=UPI0034584A8C
MQLDFFPSRTLTVYIARMFAVRIVAMMIVLIFVLMALDLLGRTGEILAVEGNGQAEILEYIALRIPELIQRFLPYSVLLATLITLVSLNQNSEVISMKAAGLSAHQILAPLLLTAAVISALLFTFNETVVWRTTGVLKAWQANDYAPIEAESGIRSNIYLTDGPNILMARRVTGEGPQTVMEDVTWYRRNPQGILAEQIRARRATYADPGWLLEDVERFDVASAEGAEGSDTIIGREVTFEQIELESVDPEAQSFGELSESIDAYQSAGRRTSELEAKWWHKISGPLSAFLMPLLGSVAAFGLARSGQLFVRAILGMALGFAYFVVDNAALAMGNFGGYPPFLAAWAPFLLFLLVGETVLVRTEE